jgi:hypothetical protein
MTQNELLQILVSKLLTKDINIRIHINGAWGIGKSYLWEQFKEKAKQQKFKTIYVSLFGADSTETILQKIKTDYLLAESKSESSIFKKTVNDIFDNKTLKNIISALSTKYIGISFDPFSVIPLSLGEDYIVCFDDLERISNKLKIEEILGLIESIALKSKIVVISNDKNIRENHTFITFKEKVIDRSYILSHIDMKTVSNVVENNLNEPGLRNTVIQFFMSQQATNLRTLTKMLSFVNEVSTAIEIDERIGNLCCAIVSEDVNGTNLEELSKLSLGDKNSIYFKYALSHELQSIIVEIITFYKINIMDKMKIKNFLSPELRENQILLQNLQKAFLFNEGFIVDCYKKVKKELKTKNYIFFEKCENLIQIVFYLRYYNEKLSLNLGVQEIEESAIDAIHYLVDVEKDIDQLLTLEILNKHFSEHLNYVNILLEEYRQSIIQQKSKTDTEKYCGLYNQKNYKECQLVIKSNPTIIPHILSSLDGMIYSHCDYDYFSLVSTVVTYSQFDQGIKNIVEDKFNELKNSISDKLIQSRIEMIIKNS